MSKDVIVPAREFRQGKSVRFALFKLHNPRHPALLACPHWTGRRRINSPYGMSCLTTLAVKKKRSWACYKARRLLKEGVREFLRSMGLVLA
jgi:hypothetical protein